MMRAATIGVTAALFATGARADQYPTRQGTSGLLDVADASVLDTGALALGVELRLDRAPGMPQALGPSPLAFGLGLGRGLELGLSLREGGLPGDPRPSPPLFSGALKLRLFEQSGPRPAIGLQLSADRVNWSARGALDLLATADLGKRVRLSALVGAEQREALGSAAIGPRAGVALAFKGPASAELGVEALRAPGGSLLGGALRWAAQNEAGFSLGAQWQPGDRGLRISLGFAFASAPPRRPQIVEEEPAKILEVAAPEAAPGARVFRDPVPHLRLKIKPQRMPGDDASRHLQWGPREAGAAAPPPPPTRAPPASAPAKKPEPEGNKPQAGKRSPPVVRAIRAVVAKAPVRAAPPPPQAPSAVGVAGGLNRLGDCIVSEGLAGSRQFVVLLLDSKELVQRAVFVEGWRREFRRLQACAQRAFAGSLFPPADEGRTLLLQLPAKGRR